MRSAYPVGFELSGGLDSSSVVCMAKKILKIQEGSLNKLKTFSLIFKGFLKEMKVIIFKKSLIMEG